MANQQIICLDSDSSDSDTDCVIISENFMSIRHPFHNVKLEKDDFNQNFNGERNVKNVNDKIDNGIEIIEIDDDQSSTSSNNDHAASSTSIRNNKHRLMVTHAENVVFNPCNGNALYFAVQSSLLSPWKMCQIISKNKLNHTFNGQEQFQFTVKFLHNGCCIKAVPAHHLAHGREPDHQLQVGNRVIAGQVEGDFRPGIVAELSVRKNNYRYMIFFDDGHVEYVASKNVREVCDPHKWQNVDPNAQNFIKYYLEDYFTSGVATVKLGVGTKTRVERNGKWLDAYIIEVDNSLIKVQFEINGETEWLFHGSPRLEPIWRNMMQKSKLSNSYIQNTIEEISILDSTTEEEESSESDDDIVNSDRQPEFSIVDIKLNRQVSTLLRPCRYSNHECNKTCLFKQTGDLSKFPILVKPLLCGFRWTQTQDKRIRYIAPCGQRLERIQDLYKYLRETDCDLDVECFSFEPINCLRQCTVNPRIIIKQDISNDLEKIPIPVINDYNKRLPKRFIYTNVRIPNKNVNLNLNPNFLSCCDCTDNCANKKNCQCWQLTLQGQKNIRNKSKYTVGNGYKYKRLLKDVKTGIYECNTNCQCSAKCLNRVVQQPIKVELQLFRTNKCGWGVRAVHDIPRGTFVSTYTGDLLTEEQSNRLAQKFSDEYLAQLDYVEYGERSKEGYESDVLIRNPKQYVETDSDSDSINNSDDDSDSNLTGRESVNEAVQKDFTYELPQKKRRIADNSSNIAVPRVLKQYFPVVTAFEEPAEEYTTRRLFGRRENMYIIDGLKNGNIGRFFNHSCNANLFLQNVFVDTHDIRFPWLALFARKNIKAGTELTWNYNYVVGSVPGRVLYCHCNSKKYCKGRLL